MPTLSADTVKNAYSLDLMPTLGVLQQGQEQMLYQQRLAEQRRKELIAQQAAGIGMLDETVNPLEKGVGFSPLDELHAHQLGEIKAKTMQMIMSGTDLGSTKMYLQQATNGLRQKQLDATRGITRAAALAKEVADKDPALDYNKTYQQYVNNIFYSQDDKGNKKFNPNFDPSQDFTLNTTPQYDPIKLKQLAIAELPKVFTERQSLAVDDPKVKGITYSAKIPDYLTIDPATQQTAYKFGNQIPLKQKDGTVMPIPVFEDNVILKAYGSPNLARHLEQQEKEMRAKLPASVSDDDVKRISATMYIQTHGMQPGTGVEADDSEFNRLRQERQDQENSFYKQQHLKLSQAAGARGAEGLALRKKATALETVGDPHNIIGDKLNGQLSDMSHLKKSLPGLNDDQIKEVMAQRAQVVATNTVMVNGRPMLDWQGVAQRPFLKDPKTGDPIKVYSYTDPRTGEQAATVVHFKEKQGNVFLDPSQPQRTITGKELSSLHFQVAPSLKLNKPKEEQYTESAADIYGGQE